MKDITNIIAKAIGVIAERNLALATLPVIRNLEDNYVKLSFDVRTVGVTDTDIAERIFCNPIDPIDKGDFVIDPITHLEGTVLTVRFEVYDRRLDYAYMWSYEANCGGEVPLADYTSGIDALNYILKDIHTAEMEYGFCKKKEA